LQGTFTSSIYREFATPTFATSIIVALVYIYSCPGHLSHALLPPTPPLNLSAPLLLLAFIITAVGYSTLAYKQGGTVDSMVVSITRFSYNVRNRLYANLRELFVALLWLVCRCETYWSHPKVHWFSRVTDYVQIYNTIQYNTNYTIQYNTTQLSLSSRLITNITKTNRAMSMQTVFPLMSKQRT